MYAKTVPKYAHLTRMPCTLAKIQTKYHGFWFCVLDLQKVKWNKNKNNKSACICVDFPTL